MNRGDAKATGERSGAPRTVLVFAGGESGPAEMRDDFWPQVLAGGLVVIGADSGAEHALRRGLSVDVVVGDLDSIGADTLAELERAGTRIERHPVAKDDTDLAIALDVAASLGPERIVVVGSVGGRFDHTLAAALVLARPSYSVFEITAHLGSARLHVVQPGRRVRLHGESGEIVTLLAVGGVATAVTTEGLRYPLNSEPLEPGSTRGVSNELIGTDGAVSIEAGTVLAVLPGERAVTARSDSET